MDFLEKLKETITSVLPVALVVLILNFTIAPIGDHLVPFLAGTVFLVIGLALFLTGTDVGMTPIGEKLGSVLAGSRSLWFILATGLVIGFAVTFAEPDVSVLASQVHSINSAVNPRILILFIAVGLGLFVDTGLLRVLKQVPLRYTFLLFYGVILVSTCFIGQNMASISFDASGSTTGPLASPFILAIGLGVASSAKTKEDSSFGLTGVASMGPIIAVAVMALLASMGSSGVEEGAPAGLNPEELGRETLFGAASNMAKQTAIGFAPLVAIILVLQFTVMHFPKIRFRKIVMGIIYAFVGIVIFLTGVEYGFKDVGKILGDLISARYPHAVFLLISLVFGAIVVLAEPAVWVLTKQVETVTAGIIKKKTVMMFLCIGVSVAVVLASARAIYNINYLWFIFAAVGTSLVLSFFCPPLFVGIAFDSGGVASGPMSTTFVLSFAMGASVSADMAFGVVGLIAMAPLVSVQILGIMFKVKQRRHLEKGAEYGAGTGSVGNGIPAAGGSASNETGGNA